MVFQGFLAKRSIRLAPIAIGNLVRLLCRSKTRLPPSSSGTAVVVEVEYSIKKKKKKASLSTFFVSMEKDEKNVLRRKRDDRSGWRTDNPA